MAKARNPFENRVVCRMCAVRRDRSGMAELFGCGDYSLISDVQITACKDRKKGRLAELAQLDAGYS